MPFPEDFMWGAAAASYQIEGAAQEDGRSPSVWDVFSHTPDKVDYGHTGDVACDHYHHYKEDVALMKQVGLKAYRLSVAWPRIIPAGTGPANTGGLNFYDRLIDELLAADIVPYVTLFHWDLPFDLYKRGSWLNRDSADWFADYVTAVANRLGDRVKHWFTFNEPGVFTNMGYRSGEHAPGDQLSNLHMTHLTHNILRAHGKGVQAIRAASSDSQVGVAPDTLVAMPASNDDKTVARVKEHYFTPKGAGDTWTTSIWLDPMILGQYPEDGLALWDEAGIMPPIQAGDMETINQPLDFLGVNQYFGDYYDLDENAVRKLPLPMNKAHSAFRWPISPEILYWGPRFLYERYKLPIYITENGLSSMDWISMDGKVHDLNRIDFTRRHLLQLERAIDDGIDVRGYFHWSIMDNFEWGEGYKQRFGLIHIDYQTQQRTLKDSAYWYRDVIASNGANLAE